MNSVRLGTAATLLLGLVAAGSARADIQVPTEPPTPQVQTPPADHPAAGPSVPVAVDVRPGDGGDAAQPETPADLGAFIKDLLDQAVAGNAAVVMVEPAPTPPAEAPAGAAKNVALEPAKPQATVTATIGKHLVKPARGDAYAPVELAVARAGKIVATEKFEVVPAGRDKAREAMGTFVAKHLAAAAPAQAAAPVASGPQLRLWMESSDGTTVKLGSQVAVYWQPSKDGYPSSPGRAMRW